MSTIYGILSFKHTVNEQEFLKMKEAMVDDHYTFYKDDHYLVATTQQVSKDGHLTFCGRIRNLADLKKDKETILDIYQRNPKINDWDGHFLLIEKGKDHAFIYKDALGIEPLYYYVENDTLYFASEIKGLLCLKDKWTISKDGILQVLGLLPALDLHTTPYLGIYHLGPGEQLLFNEEATVSKWWEIPNCPIKKSKKEIIEDIKKLVLKAIEEDMEDNTACILSGGLDSSVIVAVVASRQATNTYDVIYEENEKYFKSYAYQTTLDKPYIEAMKHRYPLHHTTIELTQKDLSRYLDDVLILRDLPGMVDIDSSLYLFIASIKDKEKTILSGECADEFAGGYPWFYKPELSNTPYFPWNQHVKQKNALFVDEIDITDYLHQKKESTLEGLNLTSKNELMYLTMQWFMQTLVIRGDVISRACHVDIRMPFASKPLFEYLWNVDWEDFYEEGKEKVLLREAFKDLLPEEIYTRKKNPFPKTHSPVYLEEVTTLLKEALNDSSSILYRLFKKEKLEELIETKGASFSLPWYGQLMTGPQLIAFIYTIHQWAKLYPIEFEI